jgi:hypothetical protein
LEALAVGNQAFVEKIKGELGPEALHRQLEQVDGTYALRELVKLTAVILPSKMSL